MTGRTVLVGLGILLVLSQYQLWFGTGSISELQRLTDELEKQEWKTSDWRPVMMSWYLKLMR